MEGIGMAAFLFVYIVCFDTQCQLTYTTRSVQLFKLSLLRCLLGTDSLFRLGLS